MHRKFKKKIAEIKTETETTVIFMHELIRYSKATSVYDKIITTKAKLQAINRATQSFTKVDADHSNDVHLSHDVFYPLCIQPSLISTT